MNRVWIIAAVVIAILLFNMLPNDKPAEPLPKVPDVCPDDKCPVPEPKPEPQPKPWRPFRPQPN